MFAFSFLVPQVFSQPVMGFNTWNQYGCNDYTASTLLQVADELVESREQLSGKSLADLGYKYVVVDDCWMAEERGADERLQPDATKFPDGIEAVIEAIHKKGLKFGIYMCVGYATCMGRPGSIYHYELDVQQFSLWGVDYIKSDFCYVGTSGQEHPFSYYKGLSDAIQQYMPHALHAICNWGIGESWKWAPQLRAHSWRTTYDIRPHWSCSNSDNVDSYGKGIQPCLEEIIDTNSRLTAFSGLHKGWNDPDMLVVGVDSGHLIDPELPVLTLEEERSHFAIWCFMEAPLMLATLDTSILQTIGNEQLLAIHQDPLGMQALRRSTKHAHIWFKFLHSSDDSKKRCALLILNRQSTEKLSIGTAQLFHNNSHCLSGLTEVVWGRESRSAVAERVTLQPHQSRIFIMEASASYHCNCL